MKTRKQKKTADSTKTVTIRMPKEQVTRFDQEAKANCMKRGTYLRSLLLSHEMKPWPALAVLAHLIAVQEAIAATGTFEPEALTELRSILHKFAMLAHEEASR